MKTNIYLVTAELEVVENPTSIMLKKNDSFCILKSTFKKKSSGKGLYQYYSNELIFPKQSDAEIGCFEYHGIKFKTDFIEKWKPNIKVGPNHHSVSITGLITDKIGCEQEIYFDQGNYENKTERRFKDFFKYIKDLSLVGTHEALRLLYQKDSIITDLKKELSKAKSSINQV